MREEIKGVVPVAANNPVTQSLIEVTCLLGIGIFKT